MAATQDQLLATCCDASNVEDSLSAEFHPQSVEVLRQRKSCWSYKFRLPEKQTINKKRGTTVTDCSPLFLLFKDIQIYLPCQALKRSEIDALLSAHHSGLAYNPPFMCSSVLGMCGMMFLPLWKKGSLAARIAMPDFLIGP